MKTLDTRPGHQLEAAQLQHKDLCDKQLKGKTIVLHTILLGVGGSIYIPHTLCHFTDLGLDPQRSRKLAYSLHEHSVQYAYILSSTRRAIEMKTAYQNHGWGRGLLATHRTLTDFPLLYLWWGGIQPTG